MLYYNILYYNILYYIILYYIILYYIILYYIILYYIILNLRGYRNSTITGHGSFSRSLRSTDPSIFGNTGNLETIITTPYKIDKQ